MRDSGRIKGMAVAAPQPWREATTTALYGEGGFYRQPGGPAEHFRTSVHTSPLYAEGLHTLARRTHLTTVVDVGSGRGELLQQLHRIDPSRRLVAVEVVARPPGLPDAIEWRADVPTVDNALLVANEWLDNVPVDVVTQTAAGPRVVLVDPATGEETEGPEPSVLDLEWLETWWPLTNVGDRAEIGWPRDAAWAGAVAALRSGIALAVDYSHTRADRPAGGTLSSYRDGRQTRPVPDGSCDLTCHVALDACAVAAQQAGATRTVLTTQRQALAGLGLTGDPPAYRWSREQPAAYVAALARAGEMRELREGGGLGDFTWLAQAVGVGLPAGLAELEVEQRQL